MPLNDLPGLVNTLQGTDSHYGFSKGNTLPLVAMPFGMNHWSPQTSDSSSWFFNSNDRKLQGVRCTHQPSPWINDYGAFVVMPQTGRPMLGSRERAGAYRVDKSIFRPEGFVADIIRYNTKLEIAPTERGAIFRFTFPAGEQTRVIIDPVKGESHAELRADGSVVGWTRGNSGGTLPGFAHYFVATFDSKPTGCRLFDRTTTNVEGVTTSEEISFGGHEGDRAGIAIEFGVAETLPLTMRVATSFISLEQAERNLASELAGDFDDIAAKATATWKETLGQIEVEGSEEDRRTFYTCLYRTQLFPRTFHEYDAEGKPYHYSPYSGKVHPGVLYTDNGFWDTYRTMYPLLALLNPKRLAEILEGWVNAYKEGGWFPQWASPGYRACMVGTHIDAVFADGIARGVTDFDIKSALEGMLKHADTPGDPDGAWGRIGIADYRRLGYVPNDLHHEAVARSLDYAYDDFCIAKVAEHQGETEVANRLLGAAKSYVNLFDNEVGFMRGKNADGQWQTPWNEFQWGSPFVEGGPWQGSWAVQHDAAGLIKLMGGDEAFTKKLDKMLATPPLFEVGTYGMEIHEMTEMADADFGQYAHSNQPVHHVLYLYNAAGNPWRAQKEVRRVMSELYSPYKQPGDEDNGEMSAWYVLSSLGIFPLTPGLPTFTFGSPVFTKATVKLPSGKKLVVEAPDNDAESVYVERIEWNGALHESLEIGHATIAEGGSLVFHMSKTPKTSPVAAAHRPTSLSPYESE